MKKELEIMGLSSNRNEYTFHDTKRETYNEIQDLDDDLEKHFMKNQDNINKFNKSISSSNTEKKCNRILLSKSNSKYDVKRRNDSQNYSMDSYSAGFGNKSRQDNLDIDNNIILKQKYVGNDISKNDESEFEALKKDLKLAHHTPSKIERKLDDYTDSNLNVTNTKSNTRIKEANKSDDSCVVRPSASQIQDLIELSELMETKLLKSNEQKLKLLNRIKELDKENDYLNKKILKLQQELEEANNSNTMIINQEKDMEAKINSMQEKFKAKVIEFGNGLEEKEQIIEGLHKIIESKESYLNNLVLKQEDLIKNYQALQNKFTSYSAEMNELLKQKDNEIHEVQRVLVSKKTDNEHEIEIQFLKEDNKRLLSMLKSTEEYKQFCLKAENNGMTLLNNFSEQHLNTEDNSHLKVKGDYKESEWIPKEAIKISNEFMKNTSLPENQIVDLLNSLNKIWAAREKELVAKINQSHKREIEEYKRKLVLISKSDELVNQKTINILRKENKTLKEELKICEKDLSKLKTLPKGMETLQKAALNNASHLKLIRDQQEQIQNFKSQLYLLQADLKLKEDQLLSQKNQKILTISQNTQKEEAQLRKSHFKHKVDFMVESTSESLSLIVTELSNRLSLIVKDYESNPSLISKLTSWANESILSIIKIKLEEMISS